MVSFAEFVKKESFVRNLTDGAICVDLVSLRGWVEDEIKSTMKEMKSFCSVKDVNWFAGRIFVLEKMLEGLV